MIRQMLVAVAIVSVVLSGAVAVFPGLAAGQDEIRIGVPGAVTGAVAYLGQHMRWGSAEAVGAAERLLNREQVVVLTGDICSSATLALMPVVERAQVPMVVAISTHPGITEKAGVGCNKWVFRTNPTDIAMAKSMAAYIAKKGYKNVAFLVEDTDYGRTGMEILRKELEAKGIQAVSTDVFNQVAL